MAADKPSSWKSGRITGPASYFPSIEKTYGRPIAEWMAIIRDHPTVKHMELVVCSSPSTAWAMVTPTPLCFTRATKT